MAYAGPSRGALLLTVVTLIWGTTFVVTKEAVSTIPPSALILSRFFVAAVVLLPFVRREKGIAKAGLELGFLLWLGYAAQAHGLMYTTAGRSAFITAVSVVLVPVLVALLGRRLGWPTWVAAAMALVGVGLLTYDGGAPNVGDAWTSITAVSYAVYVIRLEAYASRLGARALTVWQVWGVVLFAGAWRVAALATGPGGLTDLDASLPMALFGPGLNAVALGQILYLGLITTALTTYLQTLGQREIAAPQAAIIYSSEPVWAAVFAFLVLGERFGVQGLVGAGVIVAAIFLSQLSTRSHMDLAGSGG